jgi:methyl-accepting chemotaxis protein
MGILKKFGVQSKIWFSVLILFVGYTISLVISYQSSGAAKQKLERVNQVTFKTAMLSKEILSDYKAQLKAYEDASLMGDSDIIKKANTTSHEIQSILKSIESLEKLDAEEKAKFKSLEDKHLAYSKKAQRVYTLLANEEEVDTKEIQDLDATSKTLKTAFEKNATDYSEYLGKDLDSVIHDSEKTQEQNIIIYLIVILFSLFMIYIIVQYQILNPLKMVVAFVTNVQQSGNLMSRVCIESSDEIGQLGKAMNSMMEQLQNRADIAQQIAQGNLNVNCDTISEGDILGHALSEMIQGLNQVINQIKSVAMEVNQGAETLKEASYSLSQGSTEQAASLEEITSSVREISSQTNTNAENAAQANQLAISARDSGEKGGTQMDSMTVAIQDISNSSQEINKIIKVIDDIAFQTNLLALNAAVEAARAGKHGKGFAVVADEVRNLAARSAKAAQETTSLISNSIDKVKRGTEIASDTANSLGEIVSSTAKVADIVGDINAASNEQAQGISQINIGLSQVSDATQAATAHSEETASTAQTLSKFSADLRAILSHFQLKNDSNSLQIKTPETPKPAGIKETKPTVPPVTQPAPQAIEFSEPTANDTAPEQVISLDDDDWGKY